MQQAKHGCLLRHISFDLRNRTRLCTCQREWQVKFATIPSVALQGLSLAPAVVRPDQQEREAVGQQLIVGQSVAGRLVFSLVSCLQRLVPFGPVGFGKLRGLDPFGQFWELGERLFDKPRNAWLSETFRQTINRFAQPLKRIPAFFDHVIWMNDL